MQFGHVRWSRRAGARAGLAESLGERKRKDLCIGWPCTWEKKMGQQAWTCVGRRWPGEATVGAYFGLWFRLAQWVKRGEGPIGLARFKWALGLTKYPKIKYNK